MRRSPVLNLRSDGRAGVIVTSVPLTAVYRSDSFSVATEHDPPAVCGSWTDFRAEHVTIVPVEFKGRAATVSLYWPTEP
jgi:hypothetical protein